MSTQPPLIVDSRSARREFTQCQACGKDKEHFKIKLSVCTGCRIATYCSPKCQRQNWPSHKHLCLTRRTTTTLTTTLDKTLTNPNPLTRPLPSSLISELRSFTQKFNPVIFQAGINIMHMARTIPDQWKEFVLMIILTRLPMDEFIGGGGGGGGREGEDVPRPWARFRVEHALPVPIDYVVNNFLSSDNHNHTATTPSSSTSSTTTTSNSTNTFLQLRQERQQENLANGYTGTITAMICTSCDHLETPRMLHNVTFYGFGPHSFGAVEITGEWQERFKENVERMCGRGGAGGAEGQREVASLRLSG